MNVLALRNAATISTLNLMKDSKEKTTILLESLNAIIDD